MIASICSEPKVLEVMRIVNTVINIIRIVIPIMLIFSVSLKLVSAIKIGDEDALSKVKKNAIHNVIAALTIFLVPLLVNIIVKVSFPNSDYKNCLVVKNIEEINAIYLEKEETLVSKAEESLDINDYNSAFAYLNNIKDEDKRKKFEERLAIVKEQIDEMNKVPENTFLTSTGLGRDIVATEELITACRWVLNQELVKIRLQTCTGEQRYKNADAQLPGGAIDKGTYDVAKETIPLSEYSKGTFFGEEYVDIAPHSRYTFVIIYRTVFLHNTVHYAIRANRNPLLGEEITYRAGSCAQNYKVTRKKERYDSGLYKSEIDDAQETTKYLVLANINGETTNATYHSYTGIEQAIMNAGKQGKNFVEILEDVIENSYIGGEKNDAKNYKDAVVYDCRNLYESGEIEYLVE